MRFLSAFIGLLLAASLQAQIPGVGQLVINEFLADNENGATDEAGEKEDWLELYNTTASPINLGGLYLTDKADNPVKWPFPGDAVLAGNSYLIVWLDEDQDQGAFHANFKLGAAGEFVMLSNGAGAVLDSLSFGAQLPDISYGRYPNGTGGFALLTPSFNGSNSVLSVNTPEQVTLQVSPNPARESFVLRSDLPMGRVAIFDQNGRLVQEAITNETQFTFRVKSMAAGMYTVRVGNSVAKVVVEK